MRGFVQLSTFEVALATSLIVLNGVISWALHLHLGRRLLIAAVRCAVQLALVGLLLEWIFDHGRTALALLVIVPMTAVAGAAAVRRTELRFPGVWLSSLASVGVSAWLVTAFAVGAVVRPHPWYAPQTTIPLAGIVLGNALSGISLGLERFGEELWARRDHVDTLLALGATRWEAARDAVQRSVKAGMIPTLNAMATAGIVSLPGTMTGQLLSGVKPTEAVKYQIVVLFLLAAATAFGTMAVVLLSYLRLFSESHQFRHALLHRAAGERS